MERIRAWWTGRSLRERRMLALMTLVTVPILLWLIVWRPLAMAHDDALERYRLSLDRHGRIAALAGVEVDEARAAPVIDGSLADYVTAHAAERGITLASADEAAGGVAVTIDPIGAAEASRWLLALEEDGLSVRSMRLSNGQQGLRLDAEIGPGR